VRIRLVPLASLACLFLAGPVYAAKVKSHRFNPQLLKAVDANRTNEVKRALRLGADPNAADAKGMTALTHAALKGEREICHVLITAGALVDWKGNSALTAAIASNDLPTISAILPHEKNIDASGDETPLMFAADVGNLTVVKLLLDHGASVKISVGGGWTALHSATFGMNRRPGAQPLPITKLLLDHGAAIDAIAEYGGTPLMCAASVGDYDIVKLLLDRGAAVNIQEQTYGDTALMDATSAKSLPIVKLLLQHGADPSPRDVRGRTALDTAIADKQTDIIKLLEQPHN